jgi:regulator of protease activity HflC (stomatin/prohibitin superfamily)
MSIAGTALGIVIGTGIWFVLRCLLSGFYTIDQNQRGVKTSFGRAERLPGLTTLLDPISNTLNADEKQRYAYPQVRVIMPGGPYFKFPWQKIYKVSVATQTVSIAFDPEDRSANERGTTLEAVTKDQLNTGLKGQLRYAISERNLYACLFAIKSPLAHVMGYFISILRERIANFEAPGKASLVQDPNASPLLAVQGISINDLRKNLSDLNRHMDQECASSAARYGVMLDAVLITGIDPPEEVETALAAINTAHNQVSSEISLAQAAADQKIVQSKKAVEIETNKAQAEVQLLNQMAAQLADLKKNGPGALQSYVRNIRLKLFSQSSRVILEAKK